MDDDIEVAIKVKIRSNFFKGHSGHPYQMSGYYGVQYVGIVCTSIRLDDVITRSS